MVSNTKEVALEQAIQKHLTGFTSEDLTRQPAPAGGGAYRIGLPGDFNAQFALDTVMFWRFLQATQDKELAKLQSRNPSDWQAKILERFDRMIKKHGLLHLLKNYTYCSAVFVNIYISGNILQTFRTNPNRWRVLASTALSRISRGNGILLLSKQRTTDA